MNKSKTSNSSKARQAYCIECGKVAKNPISGEYPELGEWLCDEKCLEAYEKRGEVA